MQGKVLKSVGSLVVIFVVVVAVSFFATPYIKETIRRSQYKFQPYTGEVTLTKSVNVTGCKINPIAAFTYRGSSIRFTNGDPRSHVLFFNEGKFIVPAQGFLDIKFDFFKKSDRASYDCDSQKHVGLISLISATSTSSTNQTATSTSR